MPFRSHAVNATKSSALAITKPTGTIDTDWLTAWAVADTGGSMIITTGGLFTDVAYIYTAGPDAQAFWVGMRRAGGSEGASYTLTETVTAAGIIGGIECFSGLLDTQPHRFSIGSSTATNPSPWNVTSAAFSSITATTCDLVFLAGADTFGGDAVFTAPGGFTIPTGGDIRDGYHNGFSCYQDTQAAGETGAETAIATEASGGGYACVCLALEHPGGGATIGRPVLSGATLRSLTQGRILNFKLREAQLWAEAKYLHERDQRLRRAA